MDGKHLIYLIFPYVPFPSSGSKTVVINKNVYSLICVLHMKNRTSQFISFYFDTAFLYGGGGKGGGVSLHSRKRLK